MVIKNRRKKCVVKFVKKIRQKIRHATIYKALQNTTISFEDFDFWPKLYLDLYPSLENSKIHITYSIVKDSNADLTVGN